MWNKIKKYIVAKTKDAIIGKVFDWIIFGILYEFLRRQAMKLPFDTVLENNFWFQFFTEPFFISVYAIFLTLLVYWSFLFLQNKKYRKSLVQNENIMPSNKNKQKELVEIVRRHYINETIILDGYKYVECQFDACTVKYSGNKFELDDTAINSNCKMVFTHPIAVVTSKLLYAKFKNEKSIQILDEYNRVVNDETFLSISEKSKF